MSSAATAGRVVAVLRETRRVARGVDAALAGSRDQASGADKRLQAQNDLMAEVHCAPSSRTSQPPSRHSEHFDTFVWRVMEEQHCC